MRKRMPVPVKVGFFSLMIVLSLILAFLPGTAFADRSLTMDRLIIDADVLPDASMRVTETVTVDFSGTWNGFFVEIPEGAAEVTDVVVSEDGAPYAFNPGTEYGPPGTYLTKQQGGDLLIDWSISAADEVRTFDISYRVAGAVTVHSDTAELYRKFVGKANGNPIGYVEVNLKLPPGADECKLGEDIRIWGHGPLHGEVEFDGADGVVWKIHDLPPHTFMEGRVVMPTGLFADAPETARAAEPALARIMAEEQKNADRANRTRAFARVQTGLAAGIVSAAFAGALLMWRRFGRRHRADFDGEYCRELPAAYSPAELSVLWNFTKLQSRDFTATILDLARRGFLRLDEETVQKRRFLRAKEVTTYRVFFLSALEPPKPHEQQLIEFLQNTVGSGADSINLADIETYARRNGKDFYSFWKRWAAGVLDAADKHKFFDDHGRVPRYITLGGVALLILGGVLVPRAVLIGIAVIIAGLIFLGLPFLFKRRSVAGEEDYARWRAFKRFLQHFSEMQRHEIPSLAIWEHYLVYAVSLGVAKEVVKQLHLVYPDLQDGEYRFGYGWWHYGAYSSVHSCTNSLDGIGHAIDRAVATAQRAVSKTSSGSGGGGGFSGGGGFGGGGGSYGGR